jgi:anti-sigma factor RsiW
MTMNCERGVARLMDYLEGVVPRAARERIESHVAGCARCRAFVVSYRATPLILRVATARKPTVDERRRLLAALSARRHGRES